MPHGSVPVHGPGVGDRWSSSYKVDWCLRLYWNFSVSNIWKGLGVETVDGIQKSDLVFHLSLLRQVTNSGEFEVKPENTGEIFLVLQRNFLLTGDPDNG